MAVYDKTKHNELISHEANLTEKIKDLRDELNDVALSDKTFEGAIKDNYGLKGDLYLRYRDERDEVRKQIETMNLTNPVKVKANENKLLNRFLKRGFNGIEHEEKVLFETREEDGVPMFAGANSEGITIRAAATKSDDATGQKITDDRVVPDVINRLADYGGLDRIAQKIMTENGSALRYPQADNTAKKGRILENQDTAAQVNNIASFTDISFGARTATTDSIRITNEMLTDGIINVGAFAENECLRRLGRTWDDEFTVDGDGTGTRARSLVNSTTKGADLGTADTISRQDLNNLIYSINRAYRNRGEMGEGGRMDSLNGMIGFLITDELEHSLMDLDDGDGRPLWVPSMREGAPDRIVRYPYQVSTATGFTGDENSAAGTKIAWFGNFGYYGIRTVGSISIYRFFDSRTAQNNAIEILGFSRRDARAMGAQGGGAVGTTETIKYLATI